ncbi:MAG: GIY-YIG nuclease family protein [Mucilaginibacter polytrichastri]|nr:GIY-YIG nuclease family protein [Mucilaginibacter polytrichastri]
MLYALVDIETTGGHAAAHGITEVAICIHNGEKIIEEYETLINPHQPIPVFIQAMTGITDDMVASAPDFSQVADKIHALLAGKIFVAHNVNFDYSFLKHHLSRFDLVLDEKRLCTVRLGRKIFPGLPSYGLGKICHHFNIGNTARHRAMGDCRAMAELFGMMVEADVNDHIGQSLKQRSSEYALPTHLPKTDIENLPALTGVYYFHDKKGRIIYVGKAKNLKRRVLSHFVNHRTSPQKQGFMRKINRITFRRTASDLMAHIVEAVEIKRYWPEFNRSQKQFEQSFGLFLYEDQKGYLHIQVGKKVKYSKPVYVVNRRPDAISLLQVLIAEFDLCGARCGFSCDNENCCAKEVSAQSAELYNKKVMQALDALRSLNETYAIEDGAPEEENYTRILVESGQFYGMSSTKVAAVNVDDYKQDLMRYPSTLYLNNLIRTFISQYPHKRVNFS